MPEVVGFLVRLHQPFNCQHIETGAVLHSYLPLPKLIDTISHLDDEMSFRCGVFSVYPKITNGIINIFMLNCMHACTHASYE